MRQELLTIAYDSIQHRLIVTLSGDDGRRRTYHRVPRSAYLAVMEAEDRTRAFCRTVLGHYAWTWASGVPV